MNWCNAAKLMDSATKDMYVYSYIDVIHKIFDERPLMTKWLKSACYAYNDRQVRTKDNASAVWGAFLSFFTNPMAGPNLLISWVSTRHLEVEEAHLKEFCKLMTGENWEISSYDNEAMLL